MSLAACGDEPAFKKLFTTEHFAYYVEEGATPPCEGTGQWLERYYRTNAEFLGVTLPAGETIDYYLVRDAHTLSELGCPTGSAGCVHGTTIRTMALVSAHEIVHANAFLLGRPPPIFVEGLAEVLNCTPGAATDSLTDASAPIEALVETGAFVDYRDAIGYGLYSASASFVRYLIDRFGASRFLSLYAHARDTGSRGEIDAMFQAAMGESLDGAFADWRARPPSFSSDLCLPLMSCDPSTPPLGDGEVTLGCGPSGGYLGLQEALLRFEVPNDRVIHIVTEPVPTNPKGIPLAAFYRCTGGDAIGNFVWTFGFPRPGLDGKPQIDPAQPGRAFLLDVPPGKFGVRLSDVPDSEMRIHFAVDEQPSPMRDPPCQAAEQPLALDDEHQTTLSSRWIERPCDGPWCPGRGWDVSIGPTGGALEAEPLVVMDGEASFSPGEIYICPEPCPADPSVCEVLTLDTVEHRPVRSKQTFAPGTVLHLGAPAAPFAGYFALRLRVATE